MSADQPKYQHIGSRSIRPDGWDKVTGRANYGADFSLPGMLHGAVVRSPYAHAKIKSIDFSKALALDGVMAVMSAEDLPDLPREKVSGGEVAVDAQDISRVVMARHKVLYHGQAVAAVAATTPALARRAASLVQVEYEVLPHVLDMDSAMAEDAPLLHEDQITKGVEPTPERPSNIVEKRFLGRGDVEAGFAAADIIVERTFTTPMVHQGYIEPHACAAHIDESGRVNIWCSTQGQFLVRAYTAKLTGISIGKIKVTPSEIGGGFGGKTTIYQEPVATVLARKSGRPVKIVMSREEVFRATGPGAPSRTRVKIGARKDGTITAMEADIVMDAGCSKGSPITPAVGAIFAPYRCENMSIHGTEVLTNKPKVVAYRAPGAPQVALAAECAVNELATKLSIDPVALRLLNVVDEGDKAVYGPVFEPIGLKTALRQAQSHPHYQAPLTAGQGRGVAIGFWFNAAMQSSATINLVEDGSVTVLVGTPDIGGSRASMALMAAEVLQIPLDSVKPIVADTDSVGFNDVTGGSRTVFATGWAVVRAAEAMVAELKKRAAMLWKIDVEHINWRDGCAEYREGDETQRLTLAQLAGKSNATGGPLSTTGALAGEAASPSFSVNLCDVAVDRETGKVDVTRFTCFQDAGKAIHPDYVEGQMQGGAVQGIGWALNEEFLFNADGVLDNPGFLDYRMPVASDLPMIDTVIIEVPSSSHPYGVRGVGEVPICAAMPAVVTAVNNATGLNFCDLPLSPAKVLATLSEQPE